MTTLTLKFGEKVRIELNSFARAKYPQADVEIIHGVLENNSGVPVIARLKQTPDGPVLYNHKLFGMVSGHYGVMATLGDRTKRYGTISSVQVEEDGVTLTID